jgi:hypothetical protein
MTADAHHNIAEGENLLEQGKAIRGGDVARRGETEIKRRGMARRARIRQRRGRGKGSG